MKKILKLLFDRRVILILFLSICARCEAQSSYDQLIINANSMLKQGQLNEAKKFAQQAIQQDAKGYMAYAIAAKIASQQGAREDLANFIKLAQELAPDDDSKAKVRQLAANLAPAACQHGGCASSSFF